MDTDTLLDQALTPQQRLERTRQALAEQLARRSRHRNTHSAALAADQATPVRGFAARARRAARVWWHDHPVHDAVDFARPALQDYARHKPLQLVGIAVGTGAALTLLKSWRLLSLTGVALTLLKTSDLKGVAKTLATPADFPSPQTQPSNRRTSP